MTQSFLRSQRAGAAVLSSSIDRPESPKVDYREIPERFYEDYFGIQSLAAQLSSLASDMQWEQRMRKQPQAFTGKWEFLSNMFLCTVELGDMVFPSAENAFQAMKCRTVEEMREFQYITPYEAKRRGEEVELRSNWDQIKIPVMKKILQSKFSDMELAEQLLRTEDMFLCELNYWGDTFWGKAPVTIKRFFVDGEEVSEKEYNKELKKDTAKNRNFNKTEEKKIVGENQLGKLLCEVRQELAEAGDYRYHMENFAEKAKVDVDWIGRG